MATEIEIVPIVPYDDGMAAGKELGKQKLRKRTRELLNDKYVKDTLGAMSRAALGRYTMARLETEPDYTRYPELEDIYPERLDYIRGFAKGAGCTLEAAAVYNYVEYRVGIDTWSAWHQDIEWIVASSDGGCSGVCLVGPDGVLGAQSAESRPPVPRPKGYRFRAPAPHAKWMAKKPTAPEKMVLRRPRTGYIESWGVVNEKGLAGCAGTSCSTLLDEPIEDTWPVAGVPLLRFARDVEHLAEIYRRYTLHNWGRASQVYADVGGNAMVVEKSFRRIGIRMLEGPALWCTEGYWDSPGMNSFQRAKRLEFIEKSGRGLGAPDMQYATDCAVRFTRMGELCREPLGLGYKHMNRILSDHAPFPRAVCRHGGPDTAPYDRSVTMCSFLQDLTHNRTFRREWVPWKKFPCELPWTVTQFPPHP
jgi:hypothetical protein